MRPRVLDAKLMGKLARKLGKKDLVSINKLVSRRAAKLGVSSEAALVLLAKEHGIGSAVYQRSLDPAKQAEIRDGQPTGVGTAGVNRKTAADRQRKHRPVAPNNRATLKAMVECLLKDQELLARCGDILMAKANFDRAVNQATQVLEERIRKKAQPPMKLVGEKLVGYSFNEELSKSVLVVTSKDADDQRGFTQILRGVVPAFRNRTHHHLTDSFSREEALRVCSFIDVLLRVVDNAERRSPV